MPEPLSIRTGIGYDSHRFEPGGPLVLGGVQIESDFHLHGHSDGDAICHAVTDAILGATALGDIGAMFSDTDAANKGRDSIEMLRLAVARLADNGWVVAQVDVVVIAETPKIAPHRDAMRRRIAGALSIGDGDVSIKGKTNEGMGFVGRGEGIACMATATVVRS
jgi:2-C-methyl-D-erythritol 2,4-cyclodiphosphate synthase